MIRRAASLDHDALVAVIAAAYAPYIDRGLRLPPVTEGIAEDIRDHHVWVAETEAGIVGVIVLKLDGSTAYLANLAVHPDAGGQGIGRALIAEAIAAARAADCHRIALTTHAEMHGTRALYGNLGWDETGREGDKVYFALSL